MLRCSQRRPVLGLGQRQGMGYQALSSSLLQSERELNDCLPCWRKQERGLGDTDELYGAYQGEVVFGTAYYLNQLDNAVGQVVIHDRPTLDECPALADSQPIVKARQWQRFEIDFKLGAARRAGRQRTRRRPMWMLRKLIAE